MGKLLLGKLLLGKLVTGKLVLGKLVVGEIAVGEVVTGEIVLGKMRWGNDLTPFQHMRILYTTLLTYISSDLLARGLTAASRKCGHSACSPSLS